MTKIPVGSKGHVALVDMEDAAQVRQHRWRYARFGRMEYAHANINGKTIFLHWLVGGQKGLDHKNRNGLDCRRANLRPATKSQNAANIDAHRDNKSGIKGVWWNGRDRCWQSQICKDGKKHHLGCFKTPRAAALAYKKAAKKLFGEFAT